MILYVDETENSELFIVTGLLVKSREDAIKAYAHFKNAIKDIPIPNKEKSKVYTEFKAILLDRDYRRIKIKMLEEINNINPCIIYSCYIKKGEHFCQEYKEATYITLLSKIISTIESEISVIFDGFNKPDFEYRIVNRVLSYRHVQAIMPMDSQRETGLQFVDNLCSVIRLNKSNSDVYEFYELIKNFVIEV